MSERDLEPLGADLESLLDAERSRPHAAPRSKDRVLSRVHASLAIGVLGGGVPGGGGAGLGADVPGGGPVPHAVGGAGAATGGLLASLFGKPLVLGLTAFALGGAVGAGTYATFRPAPPMLVAPAPVVTASPVASSTVEAPLPAIEPSVQAPADAPAASSASSARAATDADAGLAGHDASLAAERALLEVARNAVARKESAAAFEALGRHAREFPRGRLSEEREGLWIRALIGAGRTDEARQRASRFKKSFPRSMLIPAFESALGTIP